MAFIDIILNSTAQNLDRPFIYKVPDQMDIEVGDLA